jgi:hypothetical protein
MPNFPQDNGTWGLFEWILTALGSTALLVAGSVWKLISNLFKMNAMLSNHEKEIKELQGEFQENRDLQDKRHIDNISAIAEMAKILAAQPDKHDLQRVEDQVNVRMTNLETLIRSATSDLKQTFKNNGHL